MKVLYSFAFSRAVLSCLWLCLEVCKSIIWKYSNSLITGPLIVWSFSYPLQAKLSFWSKAHVNQQVENQLFLLLIEHIWFFPLYMTMFTKTIKNGPSFGPLIRNRAWNSIFANFLCWFRLSDSLDIRPDPRLKSLDNECITILR